jgi:proline dehydrogenase
MEQLSPGMLKQSLNRLAKKLSRSYYAGPELTDAVSVCQRLSRKGMPCTIGYWPNQDDTPQVVADAYLAGIDAIKDAGLDCSISVKAMVMDFNRDLITRIIDKAASVGVGIHYDSRELEFADPTNELLSAFAGRGATIGCTLPGIWPRSIADADLASELGVNVRVVKGMWRDPEHLDIKARQGYLEVIDRLCGRAHQVGVATHDKWLAREALQRLTDSNTACELEQLFGLPTRETLRVAKDFGVRVRFYIPYGNSWLPYALSRALRRPRILFWVARDLMLGHWSYLLK